MCMKKWTTLLVILSLVFFPSKCNMHSMESKVELVETNEVVPDIVTVTTYSISENETDSTPLLTASGFKINPHNPKRHRIIAISRDLKRKYKFGQRVRITNAGKYNGEYVVRDLMHHRWKNKIDILINPDDKHTKLRRAKMYKVEKKKG